MSWLSPQVGVLSYPHCARIQVGGACCSKCAEGKPCCSEDESKRWLSGAPPSPRVGDAPAFVESATPWDEVAKTDEIVRRFNAEVMASLSAPNADKLGALPIRWNLFFANWQVFFDAANRDADARAVPLVIPKMITNAPTGAGIPSYKDQYEKNVLDFNGFVDEFKKLGGKTSVEPVDTSSPLFRWGKDLLSGIGGAAGSAADAVTTGLIYLAVLGTVGGAAWYFGPAVLAKLLKSRPK